MKRATIYLMQFLLFAGSVLCVQAAEPVYAKWVLSQYIKNNTIDTGDASVKLAVRSGPGLSYGQVDTLSSGQKVETFESKNGWTRISPQGAAAGAAAAAPAAPQAKAAGQPVCWVLSTYIKNGAVDTGDASVKLAVRSGPGVTYSQVDTLSFGQRVEVCETRNEWVRILPAGAAVAASAPAPAPAPAAKPAVAKPTKAPVAKPVAAPPAADPVTASVTSKSSRPAPAPVRPPVENLVLNGDFASTSLALPTVSGDTTAELSGRWIRSSTAAAWEISPYGGNLGPYARAATSRDAGRLLYVVSDAKRSTGSYVLRFDYILTDASDVLGVKVFVSDRDITIGTEGGDFRMNNAQRPADLVALPANSAWTTYYLPVELGSGYNYVYVLFSGSGNGNTGVDNISLSPQRR